MCPGLPQCDHEEPHGHDGDGNTTFPDGAFIDRKGVYFHGPAGEGCF